MKKITEYSTELTMLLFILFVLGLGILTGYFIKSSQEKPTEDINQIKKIYYLKGANKMLELRKSNYNTHKIKENFYKEFENEFKN